MERRTILVGGLPTSFLSRFLRLGIVLLPGQGDSGSAQKDAEQETAKKGERFHGVFISSRTKKCLKNEKNIDGFFPPQPPTKTPPPAGRRWPPPYPSPRR